MYQLLIVTHLHFNWLGKLAAIPGLQGEGEEKDEKEDQSH